MIIIKKDKINIKYKTLSVFLFVSGLLKREKLSAYWFFFLPNLYLLVSSFISTYVWFTTLYSIIQIKFKLHPLFYGLTPRCLWSPFNNTHLLFSNSHLIWWVSRTDSLEAKNITSTRNKQRGSHYKLVSSQNSLR